MRYECLYTKSNDQFIVAKPSPAVWGEGEKALATFVVKTEELTIEQLQAKNADRIAKAQADVAAAIEANKNRKPVKAVE